MSHRRWSSFTPGPHKEGSSLGAFLEKEFKICPQLERTSTASLTACVSQLLRFGSTGVPGSTSSQGSEPFKFTPRGFSSVTMSSLPHMGVAAEAARLPHTVEATASEVPLQGSPQRLQVEGPRPGATVIPDCHLTSEPAPQFRYLYSTVASPPTTSTVDAPGHQHNCDSSLCGAVVSASCGAPLTPFDLEAAAPTCWLRDASAIVPDLQGTSFNSNATAAAGAVPAAGASNTRSVECVLDSSLPPSTCGGSTAVAAASGSGHPRASCPRSLPRLPIRGKGVSLPASAVSVKATRRAGGSASDGRALTRRRRSTACNAPTPGDTRPAGCHVSQPSAKRVQVSPDARSKVSSPALILSPLDSPMIPGMVDVFGSTGLKVTAAGYRQAAEIMRDRLLASSAAPMAALEAEVLLPLPQKVVARRGSCFTMPLSPPNIEPSALMLKTRLPALVASATLSNSLGASHLAASLPSDGEHHVDGPVSPPLADVVGSIMPRLKNTFAADATSPSALASPTGSHKQLPVPILKQIHAQGYTNCCCIRVLGEKAVSKGSCGVGDDKRRAGVEWNSLVAEVDLTLRL